MLYSWLDRWDEQRAQRGEKGKKATSFALNADLAFPGGNNITSIADFCRLADQVVADPTYYEEPTGSDLDFEVGKGWVKTPSCMLTEVKENNIVWAKMTEVVPSRRALVVFHHWNARSRNRHLANILARRGITVVEMSLPYHFERQRPGSLYADYMLGADLGRTIQSLRQAVSDGRKLIRWLQHRNYEQISVLGISLGSWIAGLIAAHDSSVAKAALFLTAGSLADMVWTGRATRMIRASLEPFINLSELNKAWAPVNLENYANGLARPDLDLQIVLAKRDKVVLPELSHRFLDRLRDVGGMPSILDLNCGHYSLTLPPYVIFAGRSLDQLLRRGH